MNEWTKLIDMDFSDINKETCCDYILINSNNEMKCSKYDILLETDIAPNFIISMCELFKKDKVYCWLRKKCQTILFKERNEKEDIIKLHEEFIKNNPYDPDGYKKLGMAYCTIFINMNNCKYSFKPNWAKIIEDYFEEDINKQAYSAIKIFSKAIEKGSNDPAVFSYRGLVFSEIKDYTFALEDFGKAIEIDSNCLHAYVHRGSTYCKISEYEKAIIDLEIALKLSPNDSINSFLNKAKQLKAEKDAKENEE